MAVRPQAGSSCWQLLLDDGQSERGTSPLLLPPQASLRVYLGLGHLVVFSDFCQILTLPPTVAKQHLAFREAEGGEKGNYESKRFLGPN